MLETINSFGRKVTALFQPNEYCTYAPPEETLGILDTSGKHDGSRGVAFLCDEIRTSFGGTVLHAGYETITAVTIIKSYETTFDDELQLETTNGVIRISDCSLNKFFFKQMIESLCRRYKYLTEEERAALHEAATAAALDHFAGEIPTISEPEMEKPKPVVIDPFDDVEDEEETISPAAAEIPEGEIVWISGKKAVPDTIPDVDKLPEDMSRDEAMSYLLDTICEINSDSDEAETEAEVDRRLDDLAETAARHKAEQEEANSPVKKPLVELTIEPEDGDIYTKASRRLRLFCEEGLLTMAELEAEVKENMIGAAEFYTKIAAEHTVPDMVAARAEALKAASDNLPHYFELGEDVAARVMFFMLYQMHSYADRIAELPETKERLNNFFCRYGSAAMALSLLDSGI